MPRTGISKRILATHRLSVQASCGVNQAIIGHLIREMRMRARLTQQRLAEPISDVSQETVSAMERGTFRGPEEKLVRVLKTLSGRPHNPNAPFSDTTIKQLATVYYLCGRVQTNF